MRGFSGAREGPMHFSNIYLPHICYSAFDQSRSCAWAHSQSGRRLSNVIKWDTTLWRSLWQLCKLHTRYILTEARIRNQMVSDLSTAFLKARSQMKENNFSTLKTRRDNFYRRILYLAKCSSTSKDRRIRRICKVSNISPPILLNSVLQKTKKWGKKEKRQNKGSRYRK